MLISLRTLLIWMVWPNPTEKKCCEWSLWLVFLVFPFSSTPPSWATVTYFRTASPLRRNLKIASTSSSLLLTKKYLGLNRIGCSSTCVEKGWGLSGWETGLQCLNSWRPSCSSNNTSARVKFSATWASLNVTFWSTQLCGRNVCSWCAGRWRLTACRSTAIWWMIEGSSRWTM